MTRLERSIEPTANQPTAVTVGTPTDGRHIALPQLTEADFQRQVTDLATMLGWLYVHFRPAQTAKGWRTPVSGPLGAGWPDLVLVRVKDRRLIFAELKGDKSTVSAEQAAVLAVLGELRGEATDFYSRSIETYLWRPANFEPRFDERSILEILR